MNKFKKLVAVLVSVVMACVFATGVFATDYVENLSAARAEVNGYLTSAGVYGMDGVVNSLNETQLRVLRDNSVALRNALTQAEERPERRQDRGRCPHCCQHRSQPGWRHLQRCRHQPEHRCRCFWQQGCCRPDCFR